MTKTMTIVLSVFDSDENGDDPLFGRVQATQPDVIAEHLARLAMKNLMWADVLVKTNDLVNSADWRGKYIETVNA